ncbi:unnamed protein product [Thlaspi arvense]|uniref:Uncharacterized protein n=1 Tax=Thlaspi arvense TaxID=13288 RepID=A0AAU9T0C5_THLAR|nr:unnamed protein product [Thlaspi arvense]
MASPLQTLTSTMILVTLFLGCAEEEGSCCLPNPKTQFHPYKDPLAAAPITSYGIPNQLTPNPGYEAHSPCSGEDQVPPVPQP